MSNNIKKYKGIKFLKVDQQLFQNVKEFKKERILKSHSIKNPSPFKREIQKKISLKSFIFENSLKKEEEKNHEDKNINNLRGKIKLNSHKLSLFNFQDTDIYKKIKKKENENKISISKFNSNPKRKFLRNCSSCKDVSCFKNNLLNNKKKIINNNKSSIKKNIVNNKINNNNFNSSNNINNKSKIKNNINNLVNEMHINNKDINIINVKTQNTNDNENKEKNKKKENVFKKFFCCL